MNLQNDEKTQKKKQFRISLFLTAIIVSILLVSGEPTSNQYNFDSGFGYGYGYGYGYDNPTSNHPSSSHGSSSDGTYPPNYGLGGGSGFYRATPTPAITDIPMITTIEEPLQPTATSRPSSSPTSTENIPEVPGFELVFAGLALFGIYVMRAKKT